MYLALACTAAIVLALYLRFRQVYMYFSRHGVKQSTPIPLVGNFCRVVLKMETLGMAFERDYRSCPEERFVGRYFFTTRQLVIRDLELIKKVTVKDFHHFIDRNLNVHPDSDQLLGRSLAFLKGKEWKDMRYALTPAFTGSKIRQMVPEMVEVGQQMIKHYKKKCQESKLGDVDVDVKDMTCRYFNDVSVSFAFALKVDSFTEINNNIYADVRAGTVVNIKQFIVSVGYMMIPKLMKALKISLMSHSINQVYGSHVKSTMQDREEWNTIRPDLIQILMEAKKPKTISVNQNNLCTQWSDDDLIAQAIVSVTANLETTSGAMTCLLYELALNPDVQEKLYQEITENETRNGGKFDYTSILQMTYLDMVVSESLRLWPAVTVLDRACNKDYNCGKPNDKAKEDFILRKGDCIAIPVWAIHRDPQYFPDPLKFDPERFSNQNKHKIQPLSYLPFGLGPRGCIASRFSICEMKVMTYQLLKEMELSPAAKTSIPAQLATDTLFLKMKECWLRMTPRN